MNLEARKLSLIQWLMNVQGATVERLEQLRQIEQADMQRIVGNHPDGTPITKAELIASVARAEQEIEAGQWSSQEDVEKESETW